MRDRIMGGRASVSIDADCHLDEFDEADVLAYAAEIISEHRLKDEPEPGTHRRDSWARIDQEVEKVATAVGASTPNFPYPASTAARITTIDQLRELCGRSAESAMTAPSPTQETK